MFGSPTREQIVLYSTIAILGALSIWLSVRPVGTPAKVVTIVHTITKTVLVKEKAQVVDRVITKTKDGETKIVERIVTKEAEVAKVDERRESNVVVSNDKTKYSLGANMALTMGSIPMYHVEFGARLGDLPFWATIGAQGEGLAKVPYITLGVRFEW